ncbi:MAG: hypothetical protein J6U14_02830 [Bacteroidaceae bacterium]|nr:hypothetical protein [Bacteroidaceae bacterium]
MKKFFITLCMGVALFMLTACGGYNGDVDHDAKILAEKVINGDSNLQDAVKELQEYYSDHGYDQLKVAQVSLKAGQIIAKDALKGK